MMKWLPWPPISSRKFQVNLTIHALEGLPPPTATQSGQLEGMMIDVKWKGPKGSFGSRFRRKSLKRLRTTEKIPGENGVVSWEEESGCECVLIETKNNSFQPWDVHFVILRVGHQGGKSTLSVMGTAVMNVADFVPSTENGSQSTRINVVRASWAESEAALVVTVNFVELRASQEGSDLVHRVVTPSLRCLSGPLLYEKSAHQFTEGVFDRTVKNAKRPAAVVDGKMSRELYALGGGKLSSTSSEESSHGLGALFDSDSVEDYDDEKLEDGENSSFRKSFSYGTLAGVNLVLEGALPSFREGNSTAQHIVSILSRTITEDIPKPTDEILSSDSDQAAIQPTVRSLLAWKKRRLSFRSPKERGEPLLNKSYGDDGGDDIDHDRRQSHSPVEQLPALCWTNENTAAPNVSGCLQFGEEEFSVGSWEKKEVISRDGHMKLSANAFFASIDQRSERAAGESACTALVAVIADWLHRNPNRMPIKTEFDTLIREGSAEWRRLCEVEAYRDCFPDGHFDLDTVLQAKVKPLMVAPGRSFVGFFQPEGAGDSFDFLQGAMSFESIWDAIVEETICAKPKECFEPAVYIVSWNDHFFILKVDHEAYYVIDTLGERLYEGCNHAYIIRFDKETRLCHVAKEKSENEENTVQVGSTVISSESSFSNTSISSSLEQIVVRNAVGQQECTLREQGDREGKSNALKVVDEPIIEGKEACKQFLKGFFAAIPLRELQDDIKKGLLGKIPLHRRLQIEFHFVSLDLATSEAGVAPCQHVC